MPLPPRVRRSVTLLGVSAGLVGAFAAGTAVTGGDDPGSDGRQRPRGGTDASPVSFTGSDLSLPESCDELLDWYVARGVDRVGPWGWDYGYYGGDVVMLDGAELAAPSAGGDSADSVQRSTTGSVPVPYAATARVENGDSGTNVQELGVDEPDVVKTDGSTLFRVEGNDLTTYDVTGDDVDRLGSADLVDLRDGEILLSGDTVVAIGRSATGRDTYDGREQTRVIVLDVSDPSAPQVEHTYLYSSSTLEARLHGDTVRLVTQAGLPDLDFVEAGRRDEREAERENREIVRESDIDDWLPTVSTDGGDPERLVDCEDVAIPTDGGSLGTIAVVGFGADEPDQRSVSGLAVDTQLAYLSADQLYLATSAWGMGGCWDFCITDSRGVPSWLPFGHEDEDGVSHLYAFDLEGRDTTYAASGEVDGTIRDRWAMDEAGGVLRVAVGPTGQTGNFNSIVTFRQDGNDLIEAGRVDKLGVNEEIQSMRWFDGLAIMVTFRQVDPLYAIDLTDPDEPELMGQLKIPGFSAYLHPLGQHRLLGLGEGPSSDGGWGAQAGLFNVTDLTDPRQLDVVSYGRDTYALAAQDPRQLTWLPDERKVLTVVSDYRRGGQVGLVSVLTLGDGRLENRTVEVEYGDDVSAVRLVPLPDGRVVLVTGGDAEFFDL